MGMDDDAYKQGILDAENAATDALQQCWRKGRISIQVRDYLIERVTAAIAEASMKQLGSERDEIVTARTSRG